jgi:hypothetical protein
LFVLGIRSRLLRRTHCRAPQLTGIFRRWDRSRTFMCCTASSAELVFRLIFTSRPRRLLQRTTPRRLFGA